MKARTALFLATVAVVVGLPVAPGAAGPIITAGSGVLAQGASLQIAGSAFGTKPTPAPIRYDDFEGGTVGQKLGNGWTFNSYVPALDPVYATDILRANSTRSAKAQFINGNTLTSFVQTISPPAGKLYMDFWVNLQFGSTIPDNYKLFRLYGTYLDYPDTPFQFSISPHQFVLTSETLYYPSAEPPYWNTYTTTTGPDWNGKWQHIQSYFVMSSPHIGDGFAQIWLNGVPQIGSSESTHWMFRDTGQPPTWDSILFGYYGYATPSGYFTYWDNVYVDSTQARVEIGDVPIYAAATHREIQRATAWSNTSLNVILNRGSFPSFSGLYLYVVDSNGVASPGFALAGVGGGSSAPSTPINLRVIR